MKRDERIEVSLTSSSISGLVDKYFGRETYPDRNGINRNVP